ncbi:energy transducer TonB [Salinibacter sp. 10B]|uniref:energy transducer TonB family protein n=1 Tax=Salinibacter sp. 10B TaxID=1923971 RepID=UPI000CF541B6|nr:energy transducer TonB [Salinibacter sp. 10B]PQJ36072.1 energy transducer TonB [Salinibacter sp. 10B]
MTRTDWIGLTASILLHVGIGLLAASLTASKPPPRQLGYVEVEFGEFSPGQPVDATQTVEEEAAPEAQEKTPEPETEPEEAAEEPQTEQVELPDANDPPEEEVPPTEEEAEPPQTEPQPEEETIADQQEPSEQPSENQQGDAGEGATEQASAPYNIEGLDRNPERAPLPAYTEQVNARIRVRITVNPEGRIVRRIPLIKGDPKLEAAVMDALQRWKFNSLPPGAPQENQTGTITFTFRLE